MHVVIVGGGAIGRLFGYYLAREGNRVSVVDTDPASVAALNSQGIEFMAAGEPNPDAFVRVPVTAVGDGLQIESYDLVLLTVKSSATPSAARSILHLVSEQVPLLSLQTGLGNVLLYLVGRRNYRLFDIRENPAWGQKMLDSLDAGDLSLVSGDRIFNLQKLFPYIPDSLNNILLHFSAGTEIMYNSAREIQYDLAEWLAS